MLDNLAWTCMLKPPYRPMYIIMLPEIKVEPSSQNPGLSYSNNCIYKLRKQIHSIQYSCHLPRDASLASSRLTGSAESSQKLWSVPSVSAPLILIRFITVASNWIPSLMQHWYLPQLKCETYCLVGAVWRRRRTVFELGIDARLSTSSIRSVCRMKNDLLWLSVRWEDVELRVCARRSWTDQATNDRWRSWNACTLDGELPPCPPHAWDHMHWNWK